MWCSVETFTWIDEREALGHKSHQRVTVESDLISKLFVAGVLVVNKIISTSVDTHSYSPLILIICFTAHFSNTIGILSNLTWWTNLELQKPFRTQLLMQRLESFMLKLHQHPPPPPLTLRTMSSSIKKIMTRTPAPAVENTPSIVATKVPVTILLGIYPRFKISALSITILIPLTIISMIKWRFRVSSLH